MQKLIFTLLFMCFALFAKADTIDYWHVYKNDIKIEEYNIFFREKEIIIRTNDIKRADSLVIIYFRDTPCYDCECYIFVKDENKETIVQNKAKGTFHPIKISLFDIQKSHSKTCKSYYQIFYEEKDNRYQQGKMFLFRIKIE